jgi:hypothetical protein
MVVKMHRLAFQQFFGPTPLGARLSSGSSALIIAHPLFQLYRYGNSRVTSFLMYGGASCTAG